MKSCGAAHTRRRNVLISKCVPYGGRQRGGVKVCLKGERAQRLLRPPHKLIVVLIIHYYGT